MARKRKQPEIDLARALNPYQATATPTASPPSAVGSIRCWSCKRPNVYDTRRTPPQRCGWCRSVLQ
jgi:hypothetical protein